MPSLDKLSERQRKILAFIEAFTEEHGFPPTIREIGKATHINSTSVVNYNLNKLTSEGHISRTSDVSRGIRLNKPVGRLREVAVQVAKDVNLLRVPLVGRIVASQPVPLPGDDFGYYYDEQDTVEVSQNLIGSADPSEVYALTVQGDSMIDSMISDGDVVVLRRQASAHNGEMVAVWLSERGETTLKHFYDEGTRIRLQPANPTIGPIYVDPRQVQVQGKVLAVLRRVA